MHDPPSYGWIRRISQMKEKDLIINDKLESVLYVADSPAELFDKLSGIDRSSMHVIMDNNAAVATETVLPGFREHLGSNGSLIRFDANEGNKTLSEAERICRKLEQAGADRDSLIVAVGGGITTDIAGFVASVYRRGVRTVFIPTTLLAQVDAAIGGKNGVNLDGRKNMIGTVRQPLAVFICPGYVSTLPRERFLSGLAEMLKIFMIVAPHLYEETCRLLSSSDSYGKTVGSRLLSDMVFFAASAKMDIVAQDQFGHGRRELLNLGHTFAHAIESVTRGAVPHGRAVAEGIFLASRTGALIGATAPSFSDKIESDFEKCGIRDGKIEYGGVAGLLPAMLSDKKKHGNRIDLIIPKSMGDVVRVPLTEDELKKILLEI